jgi:hypothetical protein
VTAPETTPLWREVVIGDTEPWRRGRLFLVILALIALLFQGLSLGHGIVTGAIEFVLVQGIFSVIFWLQFYFIWIGVHWVRWFNGGLSALYGFALIIWGFRDGSGVVGAIGLYSFASGCYLAFAPSVYFFAKRQRETVRRTESLFIALSFLVLLASLVAGVVGLLGYKANLERQARTFADHAFSRIFTDHDTEFLLENASPSLLNGPGGRAGLTKFLQQATMGAGDVHDIEQPVGTIRFWYSFPFRLASEGNIAASGTGTWNRIRMQLIIGEAGGEWKIHAIHWHADYSAVVPSAR